MYKMTHLKILFLTSLDTIRVSNEKFFDGFTNYYNLWKNTRIIGTYTEETIFFGKTGKIISQQTMTLYSQELCKFDVHKIVYMLNLYKNGPDIDQKNKRLTIETFMFYKIKITLY